MDQIAIVGVIACFPGLTEVVEEYISIPTHVPDGPLFIPPIGIGMHE